MKVVWFYKTNKITITECERVKNNVSLVCVMGLCDVQHIVCDLQNTEHWSLYSACRVVCVSFCLCPQHNYVWQVCLALGGSAPPVLLSALHVFSCGPTAAAATCRRERSSCNGPWSWPPGQKHGPGQRVSEMSLFRGGICTYWWTLNWVSSQVHTQWFLTSLSTSHIMEHLEGVIDKPEKDMTPQELQLHYFKMHDYDGNNLLDGLELATAITHVHREVGVYTCV